MSIVTIKNEFLKVSISSTGAEIQSVVDTAGKEYIWQGDPAYWNKHAPVLFPICGGLNDGYYTLEGKRYDLTKHGFSRTAEFSITEQSDDVVEFLICDTEETYKSYPFHFEFRARYALEGKTLKVEFITKNLSERTMYFACGSHEGYNLPSGIDGAKIIFEKPEQLKNYLVEGGVMSPRYEEIGDGSETLVLERKYFEIDAIILRELNSRSLTVCDKNGDIRVKVDFPDFDHLLIWQACGAPFVCIEPWTSLPDTYGSAERAIEKKESMTLLEAGMSHTDRHNITFG